ncbi:membrane metallo-endopeptidase-like 1 [Orussus abietinus]|uniref:membrane metallo-endopeptidase-like 1 n=1 Tax=Orussus abietinus TaxID=222816 RepID=UPI000C715DC6|nr:membrane metallo-endopeptidase-like 1 [Orussus abietinus]
MLSTINMPISQTKLSHLRRISLMLLIIANYAKAEPGAGISKKNPQVSVCNSADCRKASAEILRNIDRNASPCDDFYEFACGNFHTHHPMGQDRYQMNQFRMAGEKISKYLEDTARRSILLSDIEAVKKSKTAYHACMNDDQLDSVGLSELTEKLMNQGGWPMAMHNWSNISKRWQQIDQFFTGFIGKSAFFHYTVEPGPYNSKKHNLVIHPPKLILPLNVFRNPDKYKAKIKVYRDFIVTIAQQFATANVDSETIKQDAKDLIDLQITLAKAISKARDVAQVRMHLTTFQNKYNSYPYSMANSRIIWEVVLFKLGLHTDVNFTPPEVITVRDEEYFYRLANILDSTPTRVIVNYVCWIFIYDVLKFTDTGTRDLYHDFNTEMLKSTSSDSREKECMKENPAQKALYHQYVLAKVPQSYTEKVHEIIADLTKELIEQIKNSPWLDPNSREAAKKKVQRLHEFIGYLSWLRTPAKVNEYYKKLRVGDSHLQNGLNSMIFRIGRSLEKLSVPVDRYAEDKVWVKPVVEVNAFYVRPRNSIVVPSGILQAPFFLYDVPEPFHLGSIGVILGHEFTHGFDKLGLRYAYDGSPMHWPAATMREYEDRTQCLVDQFQTYHYQDLIPHGHVLFDSGDETQIENLADTAGMQISHGAFINNLRKRTSLHQRLPGLESVTDEQLFFLAYANMWCEYNDPRFLLYLARLNGEYSIAHHRVIGTVSNLEGFTTAFGCKAGDAMNPSRRCTLWG